MTARPATSGAGWTWLRVARDAWHGITPRMVLATFLLGCIFHLILMLVGYSGGPGTPWPFRGVTFVGQQMRAFMLLFAFAVAERVTGGDPQRRGVYAMAVLVTALVSAPLLVGWIYAMAPYTLPADRIPARFPLGLVSMSFFDLTMSGGAIVWVIIDRRRASRARARLHAAEVARVEAARQSVESQLQALQARVEPQFLFDTLADVKRLHARDPARATGMLDDLIVYLRSAMPRMRETSSTVARELDLVRAWLAIAGARGADALAVSITCPPALGPARLPPMMLLPLVDGLLDRDPGDDGRRALVLAVDADLGRLRIVIRAQGMHRATQAGAANAVAAVRERLAALYGERGSLIVSASAGAAELLLVVPRESVEERDSALARAAG